jgi:hypothetical protein
MAEDTPIAPLRAAADSPSVDPVVLTGNEPRLPCTTLILTLIAAAV